MEHECEGSNCKVVLFVPCAGQQELARDLLAVSVDRDHMVELVVAEQAENDRLRAALRDIENGTHPLEMVRVARTALDRAKDG
jgi:hypothetical protein